MVARWNPPLWAAQGWVIVAPNPRGSTGFGQKFVDEISRDWGGKVMTDLDAVFDAVVKLPFVDAQRQGIAGASYGGYAVNWILGHTDRFKAAVTHDGVFNLESMTRATEELWFPEWEFGGAPWTAKRGARSSRSGRRISSRTTSRRRRSSSRTSWTSACRSIRACSSSPSFAGTACRPRRSCSPTKATGC